MKKLLSLFLCVAVVIVMTFMPFATNVGATGLNSEVISDLTEENQKVTYKVNHYYQNHFEPGNRLLKSEIYEGYAGELTEAKAIYMLGYTVSTFTQKTISKEGTTFVSIFYRIDKQSGIVASDVNGDTVIDLLDAIYLQRCIAGFDGYDASKVCVFAADCNIDGSVNAKDILTLLSQLAGNKPAVGTPDSEDNWGDWV